eukprot:4209594-Amphidinium_carterae.1
MVEANVLTDGMRATNGILVRNAKEEANCAWVGSGTMVTIERDEENDASCKSQCRGNGVVELVVAENGSEENVGGAFAVEVAPHGCQNM